MRAPGGAGFFIPLFLVQFLSWGAMFALWVFALPHIRLALHLQEPDALRLVGLGLALYAALGAFVNFALPAGYRAMGMMRTHALALTLSGAGLMLVARADSAFWLLSGYALTGLGWASISTTPYALVSERVTDGRYSRAMARFNFSVVLPQITVALALGWLVEVVAPSTAILVGAGAMWLAAVLTLLFSLEV